MQCCEEQRTNVIDSSHRGDPEPVSHYAASSMLLVVLLETDAHRLAWQGLDLIRIRSVHLL